MLPAHAPAWVYAGPFARLMPLLTGVRCSAACVFVLTPVNELQVLDSALVAATTGAVLDIQWTRTADMHDFTYGKVGTNVWAKLFKIPAAATRTPPSASEASMPNRLNPLLLAPSRGLYASAPFFKQHRAAYSTVFAETFQVVPKLQARLEPFLTRFDEVREAGGQVFGLHCRMSTAAVSNAQSTGLVEPCGSTHILRQIAKLVGENDVLFVASDSANDVAAVTKLLGMRSIVQGGSVLRATATELVETHQRSGGTLKKGYGAIIDVWTLAATDVLLHNSESNLVLTAALANPEVRLTPDFVLFPIVPLVVREEAHGVGGHPSLSPHPTQRAASPCPSRPRYQAARQRPGPARRHSQLRRLYGRRETISRAEPSVDDDQGKGVSGAGRCD